MAFWFGLTNILFMDETGFYQRQSYQRSWSPVGKPCYAKIEANKGKRLNLIGAMSMAEFKLIAPVTFEGGYYLVLDTNLSKVIPSLKKHNQPA